MMYFTRERLLRCQDDVGIEENEDERDERLVNAEQEWKTANDRYFDYLCSIQSELSPAVRALANMCLHDAVITRATFVGDCVEIELDTSGAPFIESAGGLCLRFEGAERSEGLQGAAGQALLYDEIALEGRLFQYSALLEKSEIIVRFRDVSTATRPTSRADRDPRDAQRDL